ncbi:tetratricopeptide repeat protein [Rubinisphaera italica]|uniref:SEC-C motif protein n=1 Tax=Rubinisphaera italica TaxID=2527969 RepID=A0A5C5XEE1_9PLAN|nr:tetratricopeptide repeat protein [Rubinisphaera italica]TWT61164.1 hypothetical protein Pan54_18990 [Rubinisphaera italica]
MSLDPYSLCPCESGKKLKFCCSDIASDMVKALQLHEGGQSKAALKILQKIYTSNPARAWVATSLAGVHLFLEDAASARETLQPLLQESPDHPLARILEATAALDLDGYEKARSVIHRAFTKGVKYHPEMIGSMAAGIASTLYEEEKLVSARQHLAFAMRFVRDEDRQQVFMRLLDFDGDQGVPYPLRGVHNLRPLNLEAEEEKIFRKSVGLSALGCWHEAAAVVSQLTKAHPENPELWYDIGLYQAWDGDQDQAAVSLHKAASFSDDFEFATSSETLAQLFDLEASQTSEVVRHYAVDSLSKVLTLFDEIPRLHRDDRLVGGEDSHGQISYTLLDRDPVSISDHETPDLKQLPVVIGVLVCADKAETQNSSAYCHMVVENEFVDEMQKLVQQALGSPLENYSAHTLEDITFSQWADYRGLYRQYYFDNETPARLRAEIGKKNWENILNEQWPNRPFAGLEGKTPQEARSIPELSYKLAAAINVLDSFADRYNYQIDVSALREKFGLPPQESFSVADEQELSACDVLEMLRIPIESLTDDQAAILLNRTQLIQHAGFTEKVLAEVLRREDVVELERMPQIWHAYIDLARDKYDREEALNRIEQAKVWAEKSGQKFEESLQWEMRQLQFLVIDPQDDTIIPFLEQMHHKYLRKLPELEEAITAYLNEHDIAPPWDTRGKILVAGASASSISQEMWPEETPQGSSGGKLWVPGQE